MVTQKNILVSANDLISFYNSLTTTELIELLPGRFNTFFSSDSKRMTVEKMLANESILWKMMISSMQMQKTDLKIEQFIAVDENGNLMKDLEKTTVLFTGFKTEITPGKIIFKIGEDDQKYWITYLKEEGKFLHYEKIEDLVPLGIGITETYLKKITR